MGWFVKKTIGSILTMTTCFVIIRTFVRIISQVSPVYFFLYCTLAVGLVLLLAALYFYLRYFIPLRKKELGFEYVYVEDDGIVREVSEDDQKYLTTYFSPGDGGRPSIKTRYRSKNGWGSIEGFIPRRRVPARLTIGPYMPNNQPEADPYNCQ